MTKVYEYYLEMQGLDMEDELEWSDFLDFMDDSQKTDLLCVDDVEEVKAREFAKKIMEVA